MSAITNTTINGYNRNSNETTAIIRKLYNLLFISKTKIDNAYYMKTIFLF